VPPLLGQPASDRHIVLASLAVLCALCWASLPFQAAPTPLGEAISPRRRDWRWLPPACLPACLQQCRERRAFVPAGWQSGLGGALRMGLIQGLCRSGCSALLQVPLRVTGMMSLAMCSPSVH
jgi:predicted metal-binding membrane protein